MSWHRVVCGKTLLADGNWQRERNLDDRTAETQEERKEGETESVKATPSEAETQEEGRQQGESGNWYSGRTETGRMETEEELPVEEYRPPTIVTVSDIHYFPSSMTDYGEAFDELVKR